MQMDLARQLEELNKEMNEQLMADLQVQHFIITCAFISQLLTFVRFLFLLLFRNWKRVIP